MKAKDFVRKFGWELVQRDITCLDTGFIKKEDFLEHYGFDILDDLKRYVNAYELVQRFGGMDESKKCLDDKIYPELGRAITLVEEVENYNEN